VTHKRTQQDDHKADLAWSVHAALLRAERSNPALAENPFWTVLRQDAFENFMIAFGADQ
jgi:hypothetical protein